MTSAPWLAAVLAFVCLAGCSGGDRPGNGFTPPAFAFSTPVVVGAGATGETFIAVGDDGLVLACSHGGFSWPSPAWFSADHGGSWMELVPEPSPVPSGDCDVDISPGGAWAVLYDWVGGASLAVSRDVGATWSVHHGIAPPVTGVVDRPWIAFHGERLLLSYKGIGQGPGIIVVRTSDDDGATWTLPQVVSVASDPRRANHIGFDFLVGAQGTVRIPLVKYDNDPTVDETFSFLVSTDGGGIWAEQASLGPLAADVLVGAAMAGDGDTLYWAWHDDAGKLLEVHSLDDGATWSTPALVAEGDFVYTPAIAGRADGTATVAWVQSGPYQAGAARLDARRDEPLVATVVLEGPSSTPQSAEFIGLRHDAQGLAHIVYAWDPGDGSCTDLRHPANSACIHFVREA